MALVQDTPSAAAVLRSLLALSSLHRSGLHSQAAELKIGALKALGAASNGEIGTMEKMQHIAAGMLLCSLRFVSLVSSPVLEQRLIYVDT
jgi:hypothetical protein